MPVDIEEQRRFVEQCIEGDGTHAECGERLAGVLNTLEWERKELWQPLREAGRAILLANTGNNRDWLQAALDQIACSL